MRRLARMAAELQALAVDLATELAIVRRVLAADASGRLNAAVECALLRAAEARRRAARRAAAAGASKIEMRAARGGAALVRIDEGEWFRLARGDARLLRLLARTSEKDADGFPAWLTYDQVKDAIAEKTGARPTRRAIVESVYRIRKALKSVDLNEHLLQVDRDRGRLRFLLRPAR